VSGHAQGRRPLPGAPRIQKHFGDNLVLRGIDMDVGEHQVVSLIGGSGSGKSTLLRCINALEPVDAGTISVEGQLVSGPAWTSTPTAATSASSSRASTSSRT